MFLKSSFFFLSLTILKWTSTFLSQNYSKVDFQS